MSTVQLTLITGYYRCHNCGRDVTHIRKERRFRLCDDCWANVVEPAHRKQTQGDWESAEFRSVMDGYWQWYREMEARYPTPTFSANRKVAGDMLRRLADNLYPLCACGRPRRVIALRPSDRGLFGGPYAPYCDVCEARATVESIARMADAIAPDRDDEEWLDLLWKSHRVAFEAGVLPGYWFELRGRKEG